MDKEKRQNIVEETVGYKELSGVKVEFLNNEVPEYQVSEIITFEDDNFSYAFLTYDSEVILHFDNEIDAQWKKNGSPIKR